MMSEDEHKPGASARNGGGEGLGSNSEIGRKLKEYYDGLVSNDVPDKFMELLARLDEPEKSAAKAKD